MFKTWDSVESYARECAQLGRTHQNHWGSDSEDSWEGGSMEHVTAKCIAGDDSLVPEAEKLLDQLECDVECSAFKWVRSPSGAFPIVPDYLSGSPTPMRLRRRQPTDAAPVQIFVSTTCSAGLGHDTMLKRGVAILALLLKLQQIRPVQLYLVAETDGYKDGSGETIQRIRVESQPINMATACYAICKVGFARQMSYSMARNINGFSGGWPSDYRSKGYPKHRADVLGITSEDIWIGSAESWDEMITNPIAWLQTRLNKYMSDTPEEPTEC